VKQQRVERMGGKVGAVIACVRERVSCTLRVESKQANPEQNKYRDISGDPAAPCASCAQGHLFPNQIFWFEVECY
jgi:hypothetical protein